MRSAAVEGERTGGSAALLFIAFQNVRCTSTGEAHLFIPGGMVPKVS
jgi:hypothetical protein